MSAARRFSPTFAADVVPGPISRKRGANGAYLVSKGATVRMPDGNTVTRTVMSFGPQSKTIAETLKKGVPVRLDVRLDGGAVIALGLSSEIASSPKPKTARPVSRKMPSGLLDDCLAAAGYDDHASY